MSFASRVLWGVIPATEPSLAFYMRSTPKEENEIDQVMGGMEADGGGGGSGECKGGCGFFGSSQLGFFCSLCFKKTHGEEEFKRRTLQAEKKDHNSAAKSGGTTQKDAAAPPSSITAPKREEEGAPTKTDAKAADGAEGTQATAAVEQIEHLAAEANKGAMAKDEVGVEPACKKLAPSRCVSCKKKVGLLGFHCRCGGTFCEKHRYSDKHDCSFDYKTHGRDQV